MAPVTTVLVTGANVGLGFECARQLASKEGIQKVILGCRNPAKAEAAKKDLEEQTGKTGFYEILIIDVSDLAKVRKAVDELKDPVDGLVLNAGGAGGPNPKETTDSGATLIIAANVLGHVLLVDLLVEQKKLKEGGSVVLAGSEAARGVAMMGMNPPKIENGSVEEFVSICDGSLFKNDNSFETLYSYAKLVATLWMSSVARKHPSTRFVTISPGGTTGTSAFRDAPWYKKYLFEYVVLPLMALLGKFHTVDVGAKRYVDALTDEETYKTGIFYASKEGVSGDELVDQVKFTDIFHDETMQDNASAAIHKFIK